MQSVQYAYYDGTESGGDARDLQTATVEDSAGNPISVDYYRYYTMGEANGYDGGLEFAVLGAAYGQLKTAAGGTDADVFAASDSTVALYADNYFQYDSQGRATEEIASGAGCSVCSSGQGTFSYTYTASSNTPGPNSWSMETVETLPDGNTNTVYTNSSGNIMLNVFTDTTTAQQWDTYYQYNSAGQCVPHGLAVGRHRLRRQFCGLGAIRIGETPLI